MSKIKLQVTKKMVRKLNLDQSKLFEFFNKGQKPGTYIIDLDTNEPWNILYKYISLCKK